MGKSAKVSSVSPSDWMEHRGWETVFFFSEAVMIVFYCVGTTYTTGVH
jgi:hypothetical protein